MNPLLTSPCLAIALAAALALPSVHAADGATLYRQNCAGCHGDQREGGEGPSLTAHAGQAKAGKPNLAAFIANGAPAKGMPAWKGVLDAGQIGAIADFLLAPNAANAANAAPVKAAPAATYPELANFRLPVGFSISVFSDQVESARSLAVSPSGVVYVGSGKAGKVYALVSSKHDNVIDKVVVVAEGLQQPNVAWHDGVLYVGEIGRVLRFDSIDNNLDKNFEHKPAYRVIKADLPKDTHHGAKAIKVGPDGKLYIPIGAPCNVCNKEDQVYSKIHRMDTDGSHFEEFARGIRNSVGLSWHPVTRQLWFTDNGRDLLGDNLPSDKLNLAPKPGLHFGFPYCAGGVLPDPEFAAGRRCDEFVAPMAKLGPHVAALGLNFNTGKMFPAEYRNQLFIAEHGSWNRSQKSGYRVALVTLADNKVASDTVFIDGFLQDGVVVGRPVDIGFLPDGSMLVSDDFKGRVYRVTYKAPAAAGK
jgi:glucose/arabinose dehydrogenase